MYVCSCNVHRRYFNSYQSLYRIVFCRMLIHHFLFALVSTAVVIPTAGIYIGLADLSSDFSVNEFSPSPEGSKDIAHQFENSNEEALTWQDPPRNLISTPTKHRVEKGVQKPYDQGERFKFFDCGNSSGVCCMGNPLTSHRAAQRCEQSIQPCFIPFHNTRLMVYTEGDIFDAGNEVLWPMDNRLGHYCYQPEYIDDCSNLLDEEVRTFILDRKSRM